MKWRFVPFFSLMGCAMTAPQAESPDASPWSGLELPVRGAHRVFWDGQRCSVTHANGSVEEVLQAYILPLERHGWTVTRRTTRPAGTVVQLARDQERMTLAVRRILGVITVNLRRELAPVDIS
jgi:hypothetical protein